MNKQTRRQVLRAANMLISGDGNLSIVGAITESCKILKVETGMVAPIHYFEKDLGMTLNSLPCNSGPLTTADRMNNIETIWNAIENLSQ